MPPIDKMNNNDLLKEIFKNQESMKLSQQRLELAFFGDEKDKESGVLNKVNRHEKVIRTIKIGGAFLVGAILGWPAAWEAIKGKMGW